MKQATKFKNLGGSTVETRYHQARSAVRLQKPRGSRHIVIAALQAVRSGRFLPPFSLTFLAHLFLPAKTRSNTFVQGTIAHHRLWEPQPSAIVRKFRLLLLDSPSFTSSTLYLIAVDKLTFASMIMELRSRTIGKTDSQSAEPTSPTSRKMRSADQHSTSDGSPTTLSRSKKYSIPRKVCGWLVHLYTATGLLVNMYSLLRLLRNPEPDFNMFAKLNWLAILIDATDGTLARAVDIKKVIPTYDGALLDNIIDFQTFAVLPALSIITFDLVEGTTAQNIAAACILLASAYQFCQSVAKTPNAFVGFPSYWNIVVFYMFYLELSTIVSLSIIIACTILSFTPIHFIYPTRTEACHWINHGGAYIWSALMLVPTFYPDSSYAQPALYASFVYVAYYIGFSILLDARRRKGEA